MASVINTNVASLFSQRSLGKSQDALQTSLQRLSSGLRINSAKDDAAGMSISERMTSQINGLDQATRNANDGISLTQTAEGGLNDITTSLQRLRTLAVQSANASNTNVDRDAIQTESKQLTSEIDRIAGQTNFNGIKLLDGSFKTQKFQTGADANQTISVGMGNARISKLGVTDTTSLSSKQGFLASAGATADSVSLKNGDLVLNGVTINAAVVADDTASSTNKNLSAIAKAAAINKASSQTGVTATVNENSARGVAMSAPAAAVGSTTFLINGVTITTSTSTNTSATRQAVVDAINAQSGRTGVVATNTGTDTEGVTLKAADGRNIDVSASANSVTTGVKSGFFIGSYTLSSTKAIDVQEGAGNIAHAGFTKGNYDPQTAYASNSTVSDAGTDAAGVKTSRTAAFSTGDFKINGVLIGASVATDDTASKTNNAASAISKAAAINRLTSFTGVTAKANATEVRGVSGGMTSADTTGKLSINGVTTDTITTTGVSTAIARQNTVNAINAISGQTGVTAVDSGTNTYGVRLMAADGRNITVSNDGTGLTATATGLGKIQDSYYGSLTLSSGKSFKIEAGINNTIDTATAATATANGLDHLGMGAATYGGTRTGSTLADVDLSTAEGATSALSAIDNAISTVNTQRANLGSIQNRFTSTISNLGNSSDNLTSARSRIQDADFAQETAKLSRNQILQQAGVAMLGQANQLPQQVLSLLR
ncbi:flagellin [Gammaproteobacteria bacterium]